MRGRGKVHGEIGAGGCLMGSRSSGSGSEFLF